MKRNAFTKIFALVLCLMMVIGCLPISALASDWEGEIDKQIDEVNVYDGTDYAWAWNADHTEATASVTVPAMTQYIFNDYTAVNGLVLTVNGETPADLVYGSRRMPTTWTITNNTAAAATYELKVAVPVGTWDNPADLEIGANVATTSADLVYFYSWIAPEDGVLTLSFNSFAAGANADIQGQIGTYEYLSDNADGTMEIDVTAGTEYKFAVVVETADYTASEFSIQADFKSIVKFALSGATVTLGDSLQIKFVVDTAKLENAGEGHYAVITRHYADGRPDDVVRVDREDWTVHSGKLYGVTYYGIAAKEMSDQMEVVFYNANGQAVTETWIDGIRDYAMRQIKKYENTASKKETVVACVDMLNYGAAAQKYFGYGESDYANSQLTASQAAFATTGSTTTNKLVKGEGYLGTIPELNSSIVYKIVLKNSVFNGDIANCYAEISFTTHGGTAVSYKVQGTEFEVYGTSGQKIPVTGLAISDYDTAVTCVVKDANGNVLSTTVDSIGSYIQRAIDNNKAQDLHIALLNFGVSAYNYFH